MEVAMVGTRAGLKRTGFRTDAAQVRELLVAARSYTISGLQNWLRILTSLSTCTDQAVARPPALQLVTHVDRHRYGTAQRFRLSQWRPSGQKRA